MINVFEQFLNNEESINDYRTSCSSRRVCLLALKELVLEALSSACAFDALCVSCPLRGKELTHSTMKPLLKTCFNTAANNFASLLNRRNAANKLTMKLVKNMKKQDRHVNSLKNKNNDDDMSSWACEHCQLHLKAHNAVQRGNKGELRSRCALLKKLIAHGLQNLMSFSKTELKSMSL